MQILGYCANRRSSLNYPDLIIGYIQVQSLSFVVLHRANKVKSSVYHMSIAPVMWYHNYFGILFCNINVQCIIPYCGMNCFVSEMQMRHIRPHLNSSGKYFCSLQDRSNNKIQCWINLHRSYIMARYIGSSAYVCHDRYYNILLHSLLCLVELANTYAFCKWNRLLSNLWLDTLCGIMLKLVYFQHRSFVSTAAILLYAIICGCYMNMYHSRWHATLSYKHLCICM